MNSDSQFVKMDVDLSSGKFSLEGASNAVPTIIDRIDVLFEKYLNKLVVQKNVPVEPAANGIFEAAAVSPQDSKNQSGKEAKIKKASGAKSKSYNLVDFGLNETQRIEIRNFFLEKAPSGQEAEIAVLTVKISSITGNKEFAPDDIYSALRMVDRPIPKNIDGVISNMKANGRGDRKDGKLLVNHLTEDYVNFNMGAKDAKK